jgi:F-type H+-transporting ATPase subunit alpha
MKVEKQVAIIYLGTQGLLREVPVNRVKEYEEHFLNQMEIRHPEILAEFKKGVLNDDSLKKMVDTARELMGAYKK